MKIASWNVNSITARENVLTQWLQQAGPDLLFVQELKTQTADVKSSIYNDLGYQVYAHGQKTYNGVAILSKSEINSPILQQLPGMEDDPQARFQSFEHNNTVFINIYAPNGNPVDTEKFDYKIEWTTALIQYLKQQTLEDKDIIIGGDFNIIPKAIDCFDPAQWEGDALYRDESRGFYRELINLGLYDAYRTLHPNTEKAYTFWDYQRGHWPKNEGIRIDHFLLTGRIIDRLQSVEIDKEPRGWDKPSDHTPIIIDID